jgi:succinyl-diaminopimelate desuccinylase
VAAIIWQQKLTPLKTKFLDNNEIQNVIMTKQMKWDSIDLLKDLISFRSITPDDKGCQDYLIEKLKELEFEIQILKYGDVPNFFALKGTQGPLFVFAGHTDVVPAGNKSEWDSDPFEPQIRDNKLFGRGASDMKGSIAGMLASVRTFLKLYPESSIRIGLLITGDEEGKAENGTKKVVDWLIDSNIFPTWCLVGEPTSSLVFGDTIKNGRRGSITGKVFLKGKQGHVAYPDNASNPIHSAIPIINRLLREKWDNGDSNFPKTSIQIVNISSDAGADNIIPGDISFQFNLRFSPETSAAKIKSKVIKELERSNFKFQIFWTHSADPFYSEPGTLAETIEKTLIEKLKISPNFSMGGGTSDGRFLKKLECEVIEFGPTNQSIHKTNENISLSELSKLEKTYLHTLIGLHNHAAKI